MGVKGKFSPVPANRTARHIGERIKHARTVVLRMSQAQLADRLNISQGNLSKMEGGKLRPEPEYLMRLSNLLSGHVESLEFLEAAGVPREFLDGDPRYADTLPTETWTMTSAEASSRFLYAPILRDASAAGTPRAFDQREIETMMAIPRSLVPAGSALVCFRASGDAMSPTLLDGYVVVVNMAQKDPKRLLKSPVAARNSDDEVVVRYLREISGQRGNYVLVPQHTSPRFEVLPASPDRGWSILGEVLFWLGFPPPIRK